MGTETPQTKSRTQKPLINLARLRPSQDAYVAAAPRLAPLYDVSSVLSWPHVVQNYAQSIAGKKRTPDMIAGRHWEAMAREIGYRPTDVRNRVQELVDKLVAGRVSVTAEVAALVSATEGYVR